VQHPIVNLRRGLWVPSNPQRQRQPRHADDREPASIASLWRRLNYATNIELRITAELLKYIKMAKSSKLVATKRGRVLLVRRRRDKLWMFPGGRKRANETEKECLRREIKEELPKLKMGRVKLWKEVKKKNRRSGRRMNDAIFIAEKASGELKIGDKREIDRAMWCRPRGIRLTPTSRYIRDKLFL
jgi:8-oxo-dGTP diphosphatase